MSKLGKFLDLVMVALFGFALFADMYDIAMIIMMTFIYFELRTISAPFKCCRVTAEKITVKEEE